MHAIRRTLLDHCASCTKVTNIASRSFSISNVCQGIKWRLRNGLPENPTSRGILTDGPDFSYADGRPTPYTNGQRARIIKQRQHAEKIHECLGIIQYAKMQYAQKIREKQKEKEMILGRKLKPKGKLLSKSVSAQ